MSLRRVEHIKIAAVIIGLAILATLTLYQHAHASVVYPSNGGTGTSTWQTNSVPYYNGSNFTEKNPGLTFDGTRLGATYASTTALSATTLCISTDCRIGWPPGYPFPFFNGTGTTTPLLLVASTTIGNGTQTGGLTVAGGATTTGNAYFAGNVGIGTTSPYAPFTIGPAATEGIYLQATNLGVNVATGTSGIYLQNQTPAANNAQQISPFLTLEGQGWNTTAVSSSTAVEFTEYLLPVQGTTVPSGNLIWARSIDGPPVTEMILTSGGILEPNNLEVAAGAIGTTNTTNGGIWSPSATAITHEALAQYAFATSSSNAVGIRTAFYGSAASTLTVGDNYASVVFASTPVTLAASGVHNWLTTVALKPVFSVGGSATVGNTATLYIDGAATTTVNGLNYDLYASSTAPNYFGGSVGIGTTTPSGPDNSGGVMGSHSLLTVQGSTAPALTAWNTAFGGWGAQLISDNAGNLDLNDTRTGCCSNIVFANEGGNERMRIADNGSVGIGTSTPFNLSGDLTLYKAAATAANSPQLTFSASSTIANQIGALENWSLGTDIANGGAFEIASSSVLGTNTRFVINGAGNVGIGSTSPATLFSIGNNGWNFVDNGTTTSEGKGVNLLGGGCFAINGTCISGGGGGSGTVNSGTINQLAYYTGSTAVSSSGFLTSNNGANWLGIGTSTPQWLATLATSTAPQLTLTDALGVAWSMRDAGSTLYFATSSLTTFATSSMAAFAINPNGFPVFTALRAASGNNCLQIDVNGTVTNTGSPCGGGTASSTTPYYSNSPVNDAVIAVPVVSGDIIQVWASGINNSGGCAAGTNNAHFNIRLPNYLASTTINLQTTAGSSSDCNVSGADEELATTTGTYYFEVVDVNHMNVNDRVMATKYH